MRSRLVLAGAVAVLAAALVVVTTRETSLVPRRAAGGSVDTHAVVVRTVLTGPRVHYFEGALVEVDMARVAGSDALDKGSAASVEVGETVIRKDLPSGTYVVAGSVRPCDGSCASLGPQTDSCRLDLDLSADAEVVVHFRWGRPCGISQLREDRVVIPRLEDNTTVAEARTTLESLGLVVELESVMCATHGPSSELVLGISPRPGRVVSAGHVVVLDRCLFP